LRTPSNRNISWLVLAYWETARSQIVADDTEAAPNILTHSQSPWRSLRRSPPRPRIILVRPDEGTDVSRRHQFDPVAEPAELPRLMMRACSDLHTDKAERKGFKEGLHLSTSEPLSDQRPPLGVCAVHLKDMLRGIGLTVATAMVESTGTAMRSSVTERATGGRRPSHRIGTRGCAQV
jgi:hypothetical protein